MKKLIIVMALACVACSPTITGGEIDRSVKYCALGGGVDYFIAPSLFGLVDFSATYTVVCRDGKSYPVNLD